MNQSRLYWVNIRSRILGLGQKQSIRNNHAISGALKNAIDFLLMNGKIRRQFTDFENYRILKPAPHQEQPPTRCSIKSSSGAVH
ncbi:hypothetical protein [Paenibacillus sp. yr247]|uniref:hypothetical protein n=1 Tax=Paenibacillus sp. yr247 TaxID=1761880 RepID=UPI0020C8661A|nr:hypothetical protein [Paenibacillus sp. yr247]